MGRMTLSECCDALGELLDDDAAYYGQEAHFGFDSHAEAIRVVRRAREALRTMREVDAGVPEAGQ